MKQTPDSIDKKTQLVNLFDSLPLCCPLCKGQLFQNDDSLNCTPCDKRYPIISGIPDLRIFGDPYLGFENDYERARLIAENAHRFDFPGLLEFYWSNSPETPDHLRKKFIRSVLTGESKGKTILKALDSFEDKGRDSPKNVLEIGCGTGWFLVSAERKYPSVVGSDIALRWLIVAKKRFEEAGVEIPLICCCAEHLPFSDGSFDLVVINATLEHTRYQGKVVLESHRVLRPNGKFFLSTPNRYSLSVEPHVYVWGVGFLPRSWMHKYVRFRKGVDYKNIRLLSFFELKKMLKDVFPDVCFSLPDIDDISLANFSRWRRFQVRIYRWLRNVSIGKAFLFLFGPMYHTICQKANASAQKSVVENKAAYFDIVADNYFQRYYENLPGGDGIRMRKQRVLELIDKRGGRILDVGCGPGIMVQDLINPGCEIWGVDAAPRMIEQCYKAFGNMPQVHFFVGDATALDFPDEFFDTVICMGVVDGIKDYESALKEMIRVVKKDGTLIISFINLLSPYVAWRTFVFYPIVALLRPIYYSLDKHPQPPSLYGLAWLRQLRSLLQLSTKFHTVHSVTKMMARLDTKVTDVVYFNLNVFFSPLDEIFPRLTMWVTRRLEKYSFGRLRWLGNSYILKVKKIEQKHREN